MEFTLKIEAPGLEGAIHALAQALSNQNIAGNPEGRQAAVTEVQSSQQAPVQQAQPTQQPVQQQEPYQQQAPVQQNQSQQAPPVQQQQPSAVPTNSPTYTMDQLARAASQLMDAGKQAELVQLLGQFGVQALTALPQEQFGAFATKLRELGANL
ncbi:hypothetical protein JYK21_03805 [Ralstonia pickettii]|nr:hypothetical protein [Ralstonia pickettii]